MGKIISKAPERATVAESDPVEQFRRRAEVYNRLYMSTPEQARDTLYRIGILTKTGKVAKNYR